MIIGHLPAGYLVARTVWRDAPQTIMIAALIGSIAPDFDMLYFHLFDGRSTHHHEYITHRPIVWITVFLVGLLVRKTWLIAFGTCAILHVALDSIVGKIAWLWPFSNTSNPLVIVPATHDFWLFSFLTHWTFMVEIGITLCAILVAWRANFTKVT